MKSANTLLCEGETRCTFCGRRLSAKRRACKKKIKDAIAAGRLDPCDEGPIEQECPHLREPTSDEVRVYGCGCQSEIVMTAIWTCALHGRCVPFKRGKRIEDESIMRCVVCADNPANKTPG